MNISWANFKKSYLLVPAAIVVVLAISICGFLIWVELSYETEEANQSVNMAMESYHEATANAESALGSLEKIDELILVKPGEDQYVSSEELALINAEIAAARTSMATANTELADYRAKLDMVTVFKLKDDYHSYLSIKREMADKMELFLIAMESSLANIEKLSALYARGIEVSNYTITEDAPLQQLYNETIQYSNGIKAVIDLEKELVVAGILNQQITETNAFYESCNARLADMANAVMADDYNRADALSDALDVECSEQKYNEAESKYDAAWNESLNGYFTIIMNDADSLHREAREAEEEAQDFYNQHID